MLTLHRFPDTASTVVELVLHELNLAYDTRFADKNNGVTSTPAYLALHPLGLIPVLETPDGPIFETAAILLYLSELTPNTLAPAPGSPDRGAFLKWLFFTSTNLHTTILQTYYPALTAGLDCTDAVVSHARAKLKIYLNLLDTVAATRPAYLSDSQPTLLGYYIAILMRWVVADFPSTDYPALHGVLTYLETRSATLTCAAAENLGSRPFTEG